MSHIIHRSLRAVPRTAVSAQGVWITDAQGHRYLDASGGAAVSCLGHGHPDVLAAMHAQIDRLAYAHTGFFTSEVSEALAGYGLPVLESRITQRVSYPGTAAAGLTVMESEPDGDAAAEIYALANEIKHKLI